MIVIVYHGCKISDSIKQYENNNRNLVLACSALKQKYKDVSL